MAHTTSTPDQIAQTVSREMSEFGWEPNSEFIEALAYELSVADTEGQGGGFDGIDTLLQALSAGANNSR